MKPSEGGGGQEELGKPIEPSDNKSSKTANFLSKKFAVFEPHRP